MPQTSVAIQVAGLKELRRDLGVMDKALPREVSKANKAAAEIIAAEARSRAPRRSGRLATSIKAGTSGPRALVRSRLPYANTIHWGRLTRGPVTGRPFISEAIETKKDDFIDKLGDVIEALSSRHGFH